MTGRIPTEIGQLAHLTSLDLRSNELTGECIETYWIAVVNKRVDGPKLDFRLSIMCAGRIPTELGRLTSLIWLDLGCNGLTGSSVFGHHHTSIEMDGKRVYEYLLNLMSTTFKLCTGRLPTELGQLPALNYAWLNENKFTGRFLFASRMLGCCTLMVIESVEPDFRIRKRAGPLPTQLGQCTAMMDMHVYGNNLTGRFLFVHCTSRWYDNRQ